MTVRERSQGSTSMTALGTGVTWNRRNAIRVWPPYPDGSVVWLDPEGPYEFGQAVPCGSVESMTDVVGNVRGFNACTHSRHIPWNLRHTFQGGVVSSEILQSVDGTARYCEVQLDGQPNIDLMLSAFIDPDHPEYRPYVDLPPVNWNSLVTDVGEALRGDMHAGSNILSSILQIGQTFRMLKNPFGLLRRSHLHDGKSFKVISGMKTAASSLLEYRWGWKQLYRDCKSLATSLEEARQHVRYLQESLNSYAPVARRQQDVVPFTLPYNPIGSQLQSMQLEATDCLCTRTACFGAKILRGQAFHIMSTREYYLQRIGIDRLWDALWDIIPYSFLVDWFVDLSGWAYNNPITWRNMNLRDVGYSVKTEYQAGLNVCSLWPLWGQTSEEYPSNSYVVPSQVVLRDYQRNAGFPPDTNTVGMFGDLSMQQLSSAAALVVQRLR